MPSRASAFTSAQREMGKGSDVFEWGTAAFSKIACARPAYLQVISRSSPSAAMLLHP